MAGLLWYGIDDSVYSEIIRLAINNNPEIIKLGCAVVLNNILYHTSQKDLHEIRYHVPSPNRINPYYTKLLCSMDSAQLFHLSFFLVKILAALFGEQEKRVLPISYNNEKPKLTDLYINNKSR